jgi:hypothetical protein
VKRKVFAGQQCEQRWQLTTALESLHALIVFSRGVVAVDVSTRASIWLSYEQTHLRLNGWYVALI